MELLEAERYYLWGNLLTPFRFLASLAFEEVAINILLLWKRDHYMYICILTVDSRVTISILNFFL